MADDQIPQAQSSSLPSRIEGYLKEVQFLVHRGVEHPRCEMKRECSIANEDTKSRLTFVKLVQGIANAHVAEERFLVIGADQKEQRFFPVVNADEFDPAKLSAILGRYLDPLPSFEAFNALTSDDGSRFVLLVLSASQPRPIVVKADAETTDGSFRIRKGEVWIKENTGLRLATRQDIETIYEGRIEAEAESRSRERFAIVRDELVAQLRVGFPSGPRIPTKDILFGKDEDFRLFVQELLAKRDDSPFLMLIEILRDILIEGWHEMDAFTPGSPSDFSEFVGKVSAHKKNQFLPALRRLVETGLLIIKHNLRRPSFGVDSVGPDWFEVVANLLVEVFQSSNQLERLRSIQSLRDVEQIHTQERLDHWFPALEALISARTLAIYAFRRRRYEFLPPLLKSLVRPVGETSHESQPFCFWPLNFSLVIPEGRTEYCWESRVKESWGEYFGNRQSFLEAACQYEFVVELNSFVGVGLAGRKSDIEKWLSQFKPGVSFVYQSDIVLLDFAAAMPIAEKFYEALVRGPDDALIYCLTVEKTLIDILLKGTTNDDRSLFLGRYIRYLRKAQIDYCLSRHRFPPDLRWGDKLEPLVKAAREADDQPRQA